MPIKHQELRKLFSDFWVKRGHKEVPPIPLVPKDDPTTLFTGSGMQQFVPYLLGEKHPLGKQLFNIQRCLRVQDIDEVGDNQHDTFFEMMGNWSLGTYFKEKQLAWCFDFFTQELRLPKNKLYVSVFSGSKQFPKDEESYQIWLKLGIPKERIYLYGPEKNWWSRAGVPDKMPTGEPGGMTSEVFFEFTDTNHNPNFGQTCHPNCDCGRFIEIGNSVFMQYKKQKDGSFKELPTKNVDFGGGLERCMMAIENRNDIFQTGIFQKIVDALESLTNVKYENAKFTSTIRIVADHIKTSVLLIKDGVVPSNKEQGYVLRRLLRRAALKMRLLQNQTVPLINFSPIIKSSISIYDGIYFDKNIDTAFIQTVIKDEIDRFAKSLDIGLREIKKLDKIDGKIAFDLYQSYGFPWELTQEISQEKNQKIDKKHFEMEFEKHKNLSRSASSGMFKGGLADHSLQVLKYHTATHLLHQALFDVLGQDVRQEGSNITGERLRFDFYFPQKPQTPQIKQVEKIINSKITESLPVSFKIIAKDVALKIGAKAFFREKYADMVKVYFIGEYSKEFCGGPHVINTKEIGKIEIYKLEKIGSNLFRIYAK